VADVKLQPLPVHHVRGLRVGLHLGLRAQHIRGVVVQVESHFKTQIEAHFLNFIGARVESPNRALSRAMGHLHATACTAPHRGDEDVGGGVAQEKRNGVAKPSDVDVPGVAVQVEF
jgi:hypothetical protein